MEFFGLHNLVSPRGARKAPKRLGRGESSGMGKTCGRGHKGQKARKSGNVRIGFEGGQNPLARRLPKRGFSNFDFRKDFRVVNIEDINAKCDTAQLVDAAALVACGLARNVKEKIKILGSGDVQNRLNLRVHAISQSAKDKVEKAGGSIEIVA